MQDDFPDRSRDDGDAAPAMGTLRFSEGAAATVPQSLGGLARRRLPPDARAGSLTDRLIRGWRVLVRPGVRHEVSAAGETLVPVGTVTPRGDAVGVLKYQPVLYASANLQEYRARRRREEQIGRFVLGAMAVAVTVSIGIVVFVNPAAQRPARTERPAAVTAPVVAAPATVRPAPRLYVVRKGDTLGHVARRERVRVRELMAVNRLTEKSKLQIGQKLVLPAAGPPDRPAQAAAPVQPALTAVQPDRPALAPGRPGLQVGAADRPAPAGVRAAAAPGGDRGAATAQAPRPEAGAPRTYTVRRGDFPEIIAKRFGLRPETVLFANNLNARSILQPGQSLRIPPADGYYHTVRPGDTLARLLKGRGVDQAAFRRFNPGVGETLRVKRVLFLPGEAPRIAPPRPERTTTRRGRYRERDTGRRAHRGFWGDIGRAMSSAFHWPVASTAISSGFGDRHRDWHPGVDIRAGTGTPIKAARDGVVTRAGWEGAYGRMVEIDHGGGVVTRYAHASRLSVTPGERVRAGEVIGRVGTSGRSTGPHLHYEVRVNGRAVNPRKVH